jgi:hypothetical protein
MNGAEHLAWCKQRALETLEQSGPGQALTSLASDFTKHEDTHKEAEMVQMLGFPMLISGHLKDPVKMRKFIEDFR